MVITEQTHHCPSLSGAVNEPVQNEGSGHARLIDQDQRPGRDGGLVVVELGECVGRGAELAAADGASATTAPPACRHASATTLIAVVFPATARLSLQVGEDVTPDSQRSGEH